MPSATASHPTPSPPQLSSSWRSAAAMPPGEHEEQGPLGVAQPGQGVVVYRPPSFEVRHGELGGPVLRGVPPDGGRSVSPRAYLRSPEHVGGVKDDAGRDGCPDK